jgi:glutaryl-CoA dehydrogenase
MPGLSAPRIEGRMSLRASIAGEIVMDDVSVPAQTLLAGVSGLQGPLGCRARWAAGPAGLPGQGALRHRPGRARRGRIPCWHAARSDTLERKQFGRPLAASQLVQKELAHRHTGMRPGVQGVLRAGRLLDEGKAAPGMISLIERNSCGRWQEIARTARDRRAGRAIRDERHVFRHMINLGTVHTCEGTRDASTR